MYKESESEEFLFDFHANISLLFFGLNAFLLFLLNHYNFSPINKQENNIRQLLNILKPKIKNFEHYEFYFRAYEILIRHQFSHGLFLALNLVESKAIITKEDIFTINNKYRDVRIKYENYLVYSKDNWNFWKDVDKKENTHSFYLLTQSQEYKDKGYNLTYSKHYEEEIPNEEYYYLLDSYKGRDKLLKSIFVQNKEKKISSSYSIKIYSLEKTQREFFKNINNSEFDSYSYQFFLYLDSFNRNIGIDNKNLFLIEQQMANSKYFANKFLREKIVCLNASVDIESLNIIIDTILNDNTLYNYYYIASYKEYAVYLKDCVKEINKIKIEEFFLAFMNTYFWYDKDLEDTKRINCEHLFFIINEKIKVKDINGFKNDINNAILVLKKERLLSLNRAQIIEKFNNVLFSYIDKNLISCNGIFFKDYLISNKNKEICTIDDSSFTEYSENSILNEIKNFINDLI